MLHLLHELEKVFENSVILGLGVSFLAGIISSLSPCIYPLIPITLGVIGTAESTSRSKGFLLSFIFVSGICLLYTVLGIFSSLVGVLFYTVFVNPATYLALAVIFSVLGLNSLGIIKWNLPFFSYKYRPDQKNLFSLFILGMLSALAIIPCNFPVLGAILSLISLKKNIVYGGVCLFFFSLGYGTILIILGTFTSLIKKLPKQRGWLIIVRNGFGILLLGVSIYFLIKFLSSVSLKG